MGRAIDPHLRPRLAGLLLAIAAAFGILVSTASAAGLEVQSTSSWKQNASPMGWSSSLNRVFYNVKGANGMFNAYSAAPDGSDPTCLTCTAPSLPGVGTATNRGVSDVSPDGKWMLLSVEAQHPGQIGAAWTQPGKGGDNNIWLASTDGSQMWPLTNITAPGQFAAGTQISLGTNWARFNRAGTQIVWASMYSPSVGNLGLWQMKVADIVWNGGVPSLANIRTIDPDPGSFYEPYGFSPDDSHIIFATSAGQASWTSDSIDTIATDGTGLTQLSPSEAPDGVMSEYNEFAFYVPGTNQILYGRERDATSGGMDYWEMNGDGTGQQRVTFFNEPWSTQSLGYSVVGGLAFDPNDPDHIIAGIAADPNAQTINAESITLSSPTAGQGLNVSYYNGQSFGAPPVSSSVGNPSDGFVTMTSPVSGLASSSYAVRWSGTVTAPVSGTYSLCAITDMSAQVYLGGNLLVNATNSFGQQRCAQTTLAAGAPTAIVMTDEHQVGKAYAQLSWITPGASTPSAIPSADLTPAAVALPAASTGATASSSRGSKPGSTGSKTGSTGSKTSSTGSTGRAGCPSTLARATRSSARRAHHSRTHRTHGAHRRTHGARRPARAAHSRRRRHHRRPATHAPVACRASRTR